MTAIVFQLHNKGRAGNLNFLCKEAVAEYTEKTKRRTPSLDTAVYSI